MTGTSNHAFVTDTVTGKVWQAFRTDIMGKSDKDFALPKLEAEEQAQPK